MRKLFNSPPFQSEKTCIVVIGMGMEMAMGMGMGMAMAMEMGMGMGMAMAMDLGKFIIRKAGNILQDIIGLGNELHVSILDTVVHHLRGKKSEIWKGVLVMAIALITTVMGMGMGMVMVMAIRH